MWEHKSNMFLTRWLRRPRAYGVRRHQLGTMHQGPASTFKIQFLHLIKIPGLDCTSTSTNINTTSPAMMPIIFQFILESLSEPTSLPSKFCTTGLPTCNHTYTETHTPAIRDNGEKVTSAMQGASCLLHRAPEGPPQGFSLLSVRFFP